MLPVLPLSWAVNCVVSPERSVMLEGVTVMPSDFDIRARDRQAAAATRPHQNGKPEHHRAGELRA